MKFAGTMDDLPALLRRWKPAQVRVDGGEVEPVPEQHKRWEAVERLLCTRTPEPEHVELLDADGVVLGEVRAARAREEHPRDVRAPESAGPWMALAMAQGQAYGELLQEERQFRARAFEELASMRAELAESWRELNKQQRDALADAHRRAQALEKLLADDRQRFQLSPPAPEEGDDEEDEKPAERTLITDVREIAALAPHLLPIVRALL